MKSIKTGILGIFLAGLGLIVSGCHFFSSPSKSKPGVVTCEQLKRQQVYNQTNMNMETNDTTLAERQALADLIAKKCQ